MKNTTGTVARRFHAASDRKARQRSARATFANPMSATAVALTATAM